MMKVRLLNDGGFGAATNKIKFPVIVDGFSHEFVDGAVTIPLDEIVRVGGDKAVIDDCGLPYLSFLSHEFEVIE